MHPGESLLSIAADGRLLRDVAQGVDRGWILASTPGRQPSVADNAAPSSAPGAGIRLQVSVGWSGRLRRVRSARVRVVRPRLTPIMIQAMRWMPWSLTWWWKTMRLVAKEAIEPTYPQVRSRPAAVPRTGRRWEPKRLRLRLRLFSAAVQLVTTGRRIYLRLARHRPWTNVITNALGQSLGVGIGQALERDVVPLPAPMADRGRCAMCDMRWAGRALENTLVLRSPSASGPASPPPAATASARRTPCPGGPCG